jgi:6-phospho-3-hexuloisomerase
MEAFKKIAQQLLDETTGMLSVVEPRDFEMFVDELLRASNVVVTGDGRSRFVLAAFARRLSRVGRLISVHGDAGGRPARRGDVLVAASVTGARGPVVAAVEAAQKRGARICSFVGEASSILASHSNHVVVLSPQTRTPFAVASAAQTSLLPFDEALMFFLDATLIAVQTLLKLDPETVAEQAKEE